MENNRVHLIGTVKRDAEQGSGVMDFCLEVVGEKGRKDFFDCRMTSQSAAYEQLEGFVNGGDEIELVGHLERRTLSDTQRMAGVRVTVQRTDTIVYVDHIIETEDTEDVD